MVDCFKGGAIRYLRSLAVNIEKGATHYLLFGHYYTKEANHISPTPCLGSTIGRVLYLGEIGLQTSWSVGGSVVLLINKRRSFNA